MQPQWKRARLLALLALLAAAPASAFVLKVDDSDGTLRPLRWDPGWTSIHFVLNDRPFELLPNLAPESQVVSAIEAAMNAWTIGPIRMTLDGTVTNASPANDGVNLITFADTTQNRDLVGAAPSATSLWYVRDGTDRRIVAANIVLNPSVHFATDGRADAYDLQDRLTRSLGLCLGLSNSPVASDTMYPFSHLGQAPRYTPSEDDIAGIRALYGLGPAPGEGAISGRVVTTSGEAVFGAHVVAVDADGIVRVSVLSAPGGRFTIPSLPAGVYQLYAEPLDGPVTPAYLSPAYQSALTKFRPAFEGGNLMPAAVTVAAGQTTAVDPIRVLVQEAPVKLETISWSPDGRTYRPAYPQALRIQPGQSAYLEIAGGKGLAQIDPTMLSISGGDVSLDPNTVQRGTSPGGIPYLIIALAVRPGAPPGPRSLYLTQADQRAVFTGCIDVTAP